MGGRRVSVESVWGLQVAQRQHALISASNLQPRLALFRTRGASCLAFGLGDVTAVFCNIHSQPLGHLSVGVNHALRMAEEANLSFLIGAYFR